MIHMITVCGVDVDMEFMPHHLPWYAVRGVTNFHYILNACRMNRNIAEATSALIDLAEAHDVSLRLYNWIGPFNSNTKIRRMGALLRNVKTPCVLSDMDEYIGVKDFTGIRKTYPTGPCVYGRFIDCFAATPPCVAAVLPHQGIDSQFPVRRAGYASDVGVGGCQTKPVVMFAKNYTRCHSMPNYTLGDYTSRYALVPILHMRWTASRRDKSIARADSFKRQGLVHWKKSRNAATFLATCPVIERE